MKKGLSVILTLIILLLSGCSLFNPSSGGRSEQPAYRSFKDIPGVTQEEINAIDELLAKKPELVYGFGASTESYVREDGSVGGFNALFGNRLNELFGFKFKYYLCDWDELNTKIESMEIDFSSDFTATPERLKKFNMTDAIVQRTIKIFSDMNSENLNDIAKTRPIKCAFLEGSTTFPMIAESWDLPFTPVFITDQSRIPEMLLNGDIDAFIEEGVIEAAFGANDFIKSEEYYPLAFSPVSLTTCNPELKPVIDVMQKYLKNGGYEELTELYNQGYRDYLKYRLSEQLSEEEKEYIRRHNSSETAVPVAYDAVNYPTSFYNTKENAFQGIAIDILEQMSDLTGLVFEAGTTQDTMWPELIDGLENGTYAVTTELFRTPQREGRFIWSSEPYYSDYYAMISDVDFPDADTNQVTFARVGLLEGTAYTDLYLKWFPDSDNFVMYQDRIEACNALEKGEIDLLMGSQSFFMHLTNYLEKPGFKVNTTFNSSASSYFGFNNDESILCSIIDKAQRYIDTAKISASWQRKTFDYESKLLRDIVPYAFGFTVIILLALIVSVIAVLKNRKINKNLDNMVSLRTNELERQTAALSTIYNSIPDLVFCKDVKGLYTSCNPSFEEFVGCSEAELIGKDDIGVFKISEEMAKLFMEADKRVLGNDKSEAIEELITYPDGSTRLMETIKTPLIQNGTVTGLMGISRDITQRKAAEETLKLTLDKLDACVYISDIDTGEILFINEKMEKEYGGSDFIGKVCWKVLQNGLPERCEFCPVPKLLKSGDESCMWEEHSTLTKKIYRNTDSLIKWHDGRIVHMQHSVDVTDLINLQQDLENASKAKGDFLSRMSHEIRTPLNAVIGMNGIAMNTNDPAKIRDCHEKIDNASKHLLGVINDILDMSKIEANKFELSYSEFNFEKTLMNITNVINFRAEEKHQNLIVNVSRDIPDFIFGDELRLSQVITNLLSNAVKFTPDSGTVVISVEKESETDGEVTLLIEVKDNGIGITEDQQARLFTSFEQADGSISRKFGGTGLGLAISKRIIELMEGRIWIESEIGKGSKFIFTVKAKIGKDKSHSKISSAINKDNISILAVDDSEDIRICFTHIMEAHGLQCDAAASGAEALDMIRQRKDKPYNIFFVDWQMPEMNGIELTKKIKEITGDNSVVFMISVSDWNCIEKEAISAGVRKFVPKPIFSSLLINAVNECLGVESAKNEAYSAGNENNLILDGQAMLIAEDVEINQEIIAALLENTGVSIDFAVNGQAAVSMFNKNPDKYRLILMDIHMPEMDGYEATRTIRASGLPRAKDIPIIAMTANVFREDVENCLAAGMNDHIGKPIDTVELFSKLGKYTSGDA